jgi:hypothetical protein
MMKEEIVRQKGVVTTRRSILGESKFLKKYPYLVGKDDLSSTLDLEDLVERQKKHMINKEDKEQMFSILRFDIKGSINPESIVRSSMSIIDITQKDISIVAEMTKEGNGHYLLIQNPTLYRSAGLSHFVDENWDDSEALLDHPPCDAHLRRHLSQRGQSYQCDCRSASEKN